MLGESLQPYLGYLSALGLGLLIGLVRERQQASTHKFAAGLRTYTLVALAGAVAWPMGVVVLALVLAGVVAHSLASHVRQAEHAPGITGEVALLLTALLGALAQQEPGLAAALAVLVALLLQAREALHRFGREHLSEAEVRDGLLLLAAGLLVLPLLPDQAVGPYGVLNPGKLWQLVVLVMAISAAGHIALRLIGGRYGLPLAGFFAGFVSSTAAIAGFGQRVRNTPALCTAAVSAAISAALASLILVVPLLGAVSLSYLKVVLPEMLAFGGVLLGVAVLSLRRVTDDPAQALPTAQSRMFSVRHALSFAAVIALVLLVSAWLNDLFGSTGALVSAAIAALAELHAAMASLAQLSKTGTLNPEAGRWALLAVLGASVLARSGVAWTAGGRAYGLRVGGTLVLAWLAALAVVLLTPVGVLAPVVS